MHAETFGEIFLLKIHHWSRLRREGVIVEVEGGSEQRRAGAEDDSCGKRKRFDAGKTKRVQDFEGFHFAELIDEEVGDL